MIDVPCPQCGLMYHSELAHLGRCIKCSRCGATVPIIESAKAVVPSRHRRDSVRRSSSLKLNRQKWGVPILALAVALAIVLTALSLVWYRRENATTVRHADLRSPGVQQSPDIRPGSTPKTSGEVGLADLDSFVLEEERPRVYHSLPTGTAFCEGAQTKGQGVLKIENGTSEDAVLRLCDEPTKRVVRCLFVKGHDSLRITGIRQGTYDLKYTTGLDWQAEARTFRWQPTYSQFGRHLVYSEEKIGDDIRYREIKVTLQPVIGGNVLAVPISREEFLRGTEDASLQR